MAVSTWKKQTIVNFTRIAHNIAALSSLYKQHTWHDAKNLRLWEHGHRSGTVNFGPLSDCEIAQSNLISSNIALLG